MDKQDIQDSVKKAGAYVATAAIAANSYFTGLTGQEEQQQYNYKADTQIEEKAQIETQDRFAGIEFDFSKPSMEYGAKVDMREHLQKENGAVISNAQTPESPEQSKIEPLTKATKDVKKTADTAFKLNKEMEELRKDIAKRLDPNSDDPPKTAQEVADNLQKLDTEKESVYKQLSDTEKEYNQSLRETNFFEYDNRAREMSNRLKDISNIKDERTRGRAIQYFEKKFNTKLQDAPAEIKELREKTNKIDRDLKPDTEKIQSLEKSHSQIEQEYKKQYDAAMKRPDAKEIKAILNQSQTNEMTKPKEYAKSYNLTRAM